MKMLEILGLSQEEEKMLKRRDKIFTRRLKMVLW